MEQSGAVAGGQRLALWLRTALDSVDPSSCEMAGLQLHASSTAHEPVYVYPAHGAVKLRTCTAAGKLVFSQDGKHNGAPCIFAPQFPTITITVTVVKLLHFNYIINNIS